MEKVSNNLVCTVLFPFNNLITPTRVCSLYHIDTLPNRSHLLRYGPLASTQAATVSKGTGAPWLRNQFYHVLRRASSKVRTCDHIPNFRINEFVRVYENKNYMFTYPGIWTCDLFFCDHYNWQLVTLMISQQNLEFVTF